MLLAAIIFLCFLSPSDEITELKKENSKLRTQLRDLERQLESAKTNGFHWPGTEPIASILPLIKDLPDNLKLERKDFWDKFQIEDVNKVLRQHNGKPFAYRAIVKTLRFNETKRGVFRVTIAVSPEPFSYKGHRMNMQVLGSWPHNSISFSCSQDTKTRLEQLDTTKAIPVTGIIRNVYLRSNHSNTFEIQLKRPQLDTIPLGH